MLTSYRPCLVGLHYMSGQQSGGYWRGIDKENIRAGHEVGPWFWVSGPQLMRRLDNADFAGYGEVVSGGGDQFGGPLLRGGGRPCP